MKFLRSKFVKKYFSLCFSDFGLRFITNRSVAESGEVEFYRNGTWNPLCFGRTSSQSILGLQDVICRQLSFPTLVFNIRVRILKYFITLVDVFDV